MTFNIIFSIPARLPMEIPVQAVLFLGIIPALILFYITLKGYEGYYKDKTVFLTFVTGIILGVIAAALRGYMWIKDFPWLVFVIIFAFFEQLLKTIVLNIPSLHFKKETTIYGLSLGLGFGSSFTPFLIILNVSISGYSNLSFISLVALGSLGFILFHAASGLYVGFGVYSGKLTKYLFGAILLQLPFNALAVIAGLWRDPNFPYFQLGPLLYGAIFFLFVVKKVMPRILTQAERRKRSKK
jgi:hypothetical protein